MNLTGMSESKLLVLPLVWAVDSDVSGWTGNTETPEIRPRVLPMLQAGGRRPEQEMDEEPVVGKISYYRSYTEGLLRRYLRFSMEAGRVSSLIGRPMFRGGRVTRYKVQGFDDVVIFVHDVEGCLSRLTERQRALIERIALQEHTQSDAAAILGMSLRSVNRRYVEAIDELSRIFLANGLMEPMIACQAACA